jgi:hypothetical protein
VNGADREHERWSEELPAYLLGSLSAKAAAECELHFRECELCREEARRLAPAVERLSQDVPRVEPPVRLRQRLMAEVRGDARSAVAHGTARRFRVSRWERPSLRPLAGAAVVLLLCAVVAGYLIGSEGSGGHDATSTIAAGHPPGVTAKLVQSGDAATLHLAHVNRLPRRRVLEAWVRRRGHVEPVRALFVPDREGRAQTSIGDMRGVDLVMVTTEPPGGSSSPTSAPIVTVAVE